MIKKTENISYWDVYRSGFEPFSFIMSPRRNVNFKDAKLYKIKGVDELINHGADSLVYGCRWTAWVICKFGATCIL